jgi:XTP/dITP diphosphohydrolase
VSRLVVASFNRAKAVEVAEILAAEGLDFAVALLSDFPGVKLPPETGDTFAINALAKARAAAHGTGLPTVADDSGLEVDALNGQPGVMSARYAGEAGSDEDRYRKVLALMASVPDAQRTARFRCAAAFADPSGLELLAEGTVEGRIAPAPAGSGGFGYDPIFVPEGRDVTMAQLTPEEKHAISHRGRAFRALARLIRERGAITAD